MNPRLYNFKHINFKHARRIASHWNLFASLNLLLLIFAWTMSANAQGVIVPQICRRPPRCIVIPLPRPVPLPNRLPFKSIKFDTKIAGQVATTHVDQVFRNETDATLEGTYFFPIPETASVSEFAIWENGRKLVGEVRSREEARRIYDAIVRQQRDPGLLEYAGKNLFQASVFPIPPRSDKRIELTYTQVLTAQSGTISYRYPLGTGRNAPAVIGNNLSESASISGRVEIESREAVRNVYSPTHAIDVVRRSGNVNRATISFEQSKTKEPQDFQMFYSLAAGEFGMTLLTHRQPTKDGYFLLMVSPPDDLTNDDLRAAKDIVFVIDTSGSMAEEGKMPKARAALLYGLRVLGREDRFNVVAFAGEERLMSAGLMRADETGRAKGIEFVEKLQATGGTNINAALEAAQEQFRINSDVNRLQMIVFMTDGLPTVGETNIDRIVENASARRERGNRDARLFTFGVGYDVNTTLLDKLAAENGGAADYVEPKEDLEVKVSSFFTKISYPVLMDLRLEMNGVEADLMYPRRLPDLFRGSQLTIIGRYRNAGNVRGIPLELTGRVRGRERTFTFRDVSFPVTNDDNEFLPRLWATRRVGWLMEQIRTNGETREVRDEIVDLGTRYGIVTPYTSFLAIESAQITSNNFALRDMPRAPAKSRTQALPMNGRSAADSSSVPMAAPTANMNSNTGAVAVQQSKQARAQQEAVIVSSEDSVVSSNVRRVRSKTFYLIDNVWTDGDFKAEKNLRETRLVFGSEEYFRVLSAQPELAEYFALGTAVVVELNGEVYRVSAK